MEVLRPVSLNPPVSMKCTESEDEEPIKGKESQLQLSCFINQEVKYLATGLRLVSDSDGNQHTSNLRLAISMVTVGIICFSFFFSYPEAAGGNHKNVRNLG